MADREKLIELLKEALGGCPIHGGYSCLADHLIANGVTIQRWIPVTERMPERGKDVLVIKNFNDRNMAVWRLLRNAINGQPCWEDEVGDGLIVEAATHWMYLPEAPKGD